MINLDADPILLYRHVRALGTALAADRFSGNRREWEVHKRVEQHERLHAFALANCALLTSEHVEQIENPVLKKIAGKLMERPTPGADSLNGTSPFPDAQDDDV